MKIYNLFAQATHGERRLAYAIMVCALADLSATPDKLRGQTMKGYYIKGEGRYKNPYTSHTAKRLFQDARDWVLLDVGNGSACSFEFCCAALDIDPDYLRKGIADALSQGRDLREVVHYLDTEMFKRGLYHQERHGAGRVNGGDSHDDRCAA